MGTLMLRNHIIIAKTITALNGTTFYLEEYFAPNIEHNRHHQYSRNAYHSYHFRYRTGLGMVPAIVVHQKKNGYEIAKETLKKMGYVVIEANEPSKKSAPVHDFIGPLLPIPREPVKKKQKPKFPIVNTLYSTWISSENPNHESWIDNPECYFCCTVSTIQGYSSWEKPSDKMVMHVKKRIPNIVVLHNKQRESILLRKKVPKMAVKIDELSKKLLTDENRILQMYLYSIAHERSHLPKEIMETPEMQKVLGLPHIRTNQKESFDADWAFLNSVKEDNSVHSFSSTRDAIKDAFLSHSNHPSVLLVRKMCDRSTLFHNYQLRQKVQKMNPSEQKVFAKKIARFLRTV